MIPFDYGLIGAMGEKERVSEWRLQMIKLWNLWARSRRSSLALCRCL